MFSALNGHPRNEGLVETKKQIQGATTAVLEVVK